MGGNPGTRILHAKKKYVPTIYSLIIKLISINVDKRKVFSKYLFIFTDRNFFKKNFYLIPAIGGNLWKIINIRKKTYLPGEFWLNMMKFWIIDEWITFSPLQIQIFFHHAFFWLLLINFSSQSQSTVQSFYGDILYRL